MDLEKLAATLTTSLGDTIATRATTHLAGAGYTTSEARAFAVGLVLAGRGTQPTLSEAIAWCASNGWTETPDGDAVVDLETDPGSVWLEFGYVPAKAIRQRVKDYGFAARYEPSPDFDPRKKPGRGNQRQHFVGWFLEVAAEVTL